MRSFLHIALRRSLLGGLLAGGIFAALGCSGLPAEAGQAGTGGGRAASGPVQAPRLYRPTITQEGVLDTAAGKPSTRSAAPPGRYRPFFDRAAPGALIPGLSQQAVPQGLAFAEPLDTYLVSAYFDGGVQSALFFINAEDGRLEKSLWLAGPRGVALFGHVGGVAVSRSHLWVASEKELYEYDLGDARGAADGSVIASSRVFRTFSDASFATCAGGVLWVGEFASYGPGAPPEYATPASHHLSAPDGTLHHALVAGYRLDPSSDSFRRASIAGGSARPDLLLSIPDRVQGMAVADGMIILSRSYGRTNDSTIESFSDPLGEPAAAILPAAKLGAEADSADRGEVPLWFLSAAGRLGSLIVPPMAEGIAARGGGLAILFESGALRYRYTGSYPLDRLYLVPLTSLRRP